MFDPICLFHNLPKSKHLCAICCLCFTELTEQNASMTIDGYMVDICIECSIMEKKIMDSRFKKRVQAK